MAGNVIDRLTVVLGLDAEELKGDLEKAQAQFEAFFDGIGRLAAAIGISIGVKELIDSAVELTTTFDSAMREVWTLTNMNAEEFEHLKEQVVELSKTGPFAIDDLSKALYQTISAGIDASNAIDFLRVAMKAAQAGATDLFTAVDGLTTALNAWNLSVSQTEKVSDAFFVAIREGKTTFQELASFIGTVAPTAAQAKISLEELLAAVAALTKQGISTRRAMTSLNYVIQAVIDPSEEAKKTAQELGIAFDAATLKAKGLSGFLAYVAQAAGGSQEKLAKLFGSVEALRGVFALAGNAADDFKEIFDKMKAKFGETEKASQKMATSLENQMRILRNRWNALLLSLGEQLKPLVQVLITLAEKTIAWIESMSPAEKAILGVLGALTMLVPAVKTATVVIAALQGAFGNLSSVAMAAAAALGMWGMFRIFTSKVENATQSVQKFETKIEELKTKIEEPKTTKTDVFERISNDVKELESHLDNAAQDAETFISAVRNLAQAVANYNYAIETGLGNQRELKKIIEELTKKYPQLANVIELVGDKYELQYDKLKNLLKLEIDRLRLQKQAAEAELAALKATIESPEWKRYKTEVEEYYNVLQKDVKNLSEEVSAMEKQLNENPYPGIKSTYEMFKDFLKKEQEQLAKYAEKLAEIRELESKVFEYRIRMETLDETIRKLEEMINKPPSPPPGYEKKLQELTELIDLYRSKLESLKEVESEEYQKDLEMLKLYIEQKRSLLSKIINTKLEESPTNTSEIEKYIKQIQELERILERYSDKSSRQIKKPPSLSKTIEEIAESIDAIQRAIEDKQKEVAERIYNLTLSSISTALIEAYKQSDKKAIEQLKELLISLKKRFGFLEQKENLREPLKPEKVDFEKTAEEVQKNIEAIQKALETGQEEVAKHLYSRTKSLILRALEQAYIEGNEEAIRRFGMELRRLPVQFGELEEKSKTFTAKNTESTSERNLRYWKEYELNVRKAILINKLQAASAEEQIQLLEELIDVYKKLGNTEALKAAQAQLETLKEKLTALSEEKRLETLYSFFKEIGETDAAKRSLNSLINFYETQLEKAALAQETIYGRGMAAINRLRAQIEAYRKELEALEREATRQQLQTLETELESAETLKDKQEILKEIISLYEQLGDGDAVNKYKQKLEEITDELEKQKQALQREADLWNGFIGELASQFEQLGDIGEAIAATIRAIKFDVVELEDGTYELVSNLEDIEQLTADIGSNLTQWAVEEITKQITEFWNLFRFTHQIARLSPWESKERTDTAELFKNFREFEQNQQKLMQATVAKTAAVVGTGAAGAIIGAIAGGPFGALIGAAIGRAIGDMLSKSIDEQIEELSKKLEATFEKIKEALGTTIEDVAEALGDAFSADTYEDFVNRFSSNLYHMTRQALIKAFLASEYMQPYLKEFSDYITKATMDGIITAAEKAGIKQRINTIVEKSKWFYDMINDLLPEEGEDWSTSKLVRETITEETGNRLAALFQTMTLHVADIKDMLKAAFTGSSIRVLVANPNPISVVEVQLANGQS